MRVAVIFILALPSFLSDSKEIKEENEVDDGVYSYHKFFGPVSGQIQEVFKDGPNGKTVDYRAKPDYTYSYGVRDPVNGNNHEHHETRDGDVVHGQYSVLQSDGATRVVRYRADAINGFQAVVEYH